MISASKPSLNIGDPGDEGCLEIALGTARGELRFPITCPRQRARGCRHHVTKNGHDTSVKGCPQQYLCHTCGASFYPHTSGFFLGLFAELQRELQAALAGGRLDLKQLAARLGIGKAAAGRLLAALAGELARLDQFARYKELPREGCLLFADETFLTISGEQWYIVALRNEHGKVLDARLVKARTAPVILALFRKAAGRLRRGLAVVVTDDFTAYQRVALELDLDIIHVRHVHKLPHKRIIVDTITWDGDTAHYTTAATTNEVLVGSNLFLARVTKRTRKRPKPGGQRRGRKPGGKNRPKAVIAAERQAREEEGPKKRGRKDYTREGEVHAFFYDAQAGTVSPWGGSDPVVAESFARLVPFFAGKHITTNAIESFFGAFEKLVEFSGRRTPARWQQLTDFYVVARQEKNALAHLVRALPFRPQLLFKCVGRLIKVKKPRYRPKRRKKR